MKVYILTLCLILSNFIFSQENEEISSSTIENVPVYKGCENEPNNSSKKKCMSEKVAELLQKNFNTIIPSGSELTPDVYIIRIAFKINTKGNIVNIMARGASLAMEKEAIRVLKLAPKMTPGYRNGKPVTVPYSLPLKVQLKYEDKFPIYRGCDKTLSNKELKKCSTNKIKDFIKLSYDTKIASLAIPQGKSTKFLLSFVINEKGRIENVNAKANHRAVAIEAIRVAKRMPKFISAGTKNGETVKTPYSILMTIYF